MKRCTVTGKMKFRDAGHASRFVEPGDGHRGLYRCAHCGFFHLTRLRQQQPLRGAVDV